MGRSGGAVAAIDVLALDRGGAHLPARLTAATATPERAWPDAISAAVFQQALADLTAAYRNIFASVAGRRKTPRPAGPGSGPARTAGRPSGSPPTPVRVLTSGKLRLPKIGDVPVRWSRPPPGGPGPGFRRLGRRRDHRPLERTGTLRLGRRHRNGSAHHRVHRHNHHPAQPTANGRTDPARSGARLLAARGERLKPGTGGWPMIPSQRMVTPGHCVDPDC